MKRLVPPLLAILVSSANPQVEVETREMTPLEKAAQQDAYTDCVHAIRRPITVRLPGGKTITSAEESFQVQHDRCLESTT